jgi:hypothetical protein
MEKLQKTEFKNHMLRVENSKISKKHDSDQAQVS